MGEARPVERRPDVGGGDPRSGEPQPPEVRHREDVATVRAAAGRCLDDPFGGGPPKRRVRVPDAELDRMGDVDEGEPVRSGAQPASLRPDRIAGTDVEGLGDFGSFAGKRFVPRDDDRAAAGALGLRPDLLERLLSHSADPDPVGDRANPSRRAVDARLLPRPLDAAELRRPRGRDVARPVRAPCARVGSGRMTARRAAGAGHDARRQRTRRRSRCRRARRGRRCGRRGGAGPHRRGRRR